MLNMNLLPLMMWPEMLSTDDTNDDTNDNDDDAL